MFQISDRARSIVRDVLTTSAIALTSGVGLTALVYLAALRGEFA